jgi:hypothetical protein
MYSRRSLILVAVCAAVLTPAVANARIKFCSGASTTFQNEVNSYLDDLDFSFDCLNKDCQNKLSKIRKSAHIVFICPWNDPQLAKTFPADKNGNQLDSDPDSACGGGGSNALILYNNNDGYDDLADDPTCDSNLHDNAKAALLHELMHAWDYVTGKECGSTAGDKLNRELNEIVPSENCVRRSLGLDVRKCYGDAPLDPPSNWQGCCGQDTGSNLPNSIANPAQCDNSSLYCCRNQGKYHCVPLTTSDNCGQCEQLGGSCRNATDFPHCCWVLNGVASGCYATSNCGPPYSCN